MKTKPYISFIVPAHNARRTIESCIKAIQESEDIKDYEIIVVFDGPQNDNGPEKARLLGARVFELKENGGHGRARNLGSIQARGDILFFVDADVTVSPTAATCALRHFIDEKYDVVVGAYTLDTSFSNRISLLRNLWQNYLYRRYRGAIKTFWSGCAAMTISIFRKTHGYDERKEIMGTVDIEFGNSLLKADARIILDTEVSGTHLKIWTLRGWMKSDLFERAIPWARLLFEGKSGNPIMTKGVEAKISIVVSLFFWLSLPLLFRTFWVTFALSVFLALSQVGFVWYVLHRTESIKIAAQAWVFITIRRLILGLGIICASLAHCFKKDLSN